MTDLKTIEVRVEFDFGDIVFLRVNEERKPGMVTRITLTKTGITYAVTWQGGSETWHFGYELTGEYLPSYQ